MTRFAIRRAGIVAFTAGLLVACSTTDAANPSSHDSAATPTSAAGPNRTYATTAEVLKAVKIAQSLTTLPESVASSLSKEDNDPPKDYFDCKVVDAAANPANANPFGQCAFGDHNGSKLMVLYGDGHGPMWTAALAGVAAKNGWKLRVFALGGCPVTDLQFLSYQTNAPNTTCDAFHASAIPAINELHPDLVVATSVWGKKLADGSVPTRAQWQDGWTSTFSKLTQPGTRLALLGDIPSWANSDAKCLAANVAAVQNCSAPIAKATSGAVETEQAAATAAGALYIATAPWVCAEQCEPVIADIRVFHDQYHFTQSYATYLTGALSKALEPVMAAN
jgi:hypothetical protein